MSVEKPIRAERLDDVADEDLRRRDAVKAGIERLAQALVAKLAQRRGGFPDVVIARNLDRIAKVASVGLHQLDAIASAVLERPALPDVDGLLRPLGSLDQVHWLNCARRLLLEPPP
jgi:hypothetical protein